MTRLALPKNGGRCLCCSSFLLQLNNFFFSLHQISFYTIFIK